MSRFGPCPIALVLVLTACGEAPVTLVKEDDPAMAAALRTQLMVDPDLVGENRANTAAILPDPDGSIPAEDDSAELVVAARSDAANMVGGAGRMKRAPAPRELSGERPAAAGLTVAARIASGAACEQALTFTAAWAAKMPSTFPVYPRAAVQEAAGSDAPGCRLRAVNFTTPVPLGDVIDFYYTRAKKAGFAPRHTVRGGEFSLAGTNDGNRFAVHASERDDGMTSVDLVMEGG